MFKNQAVNVKCESVEEFLARGGKIQKVAPSASGKKRTSTPKKKEKTVDPQALLDAATGTPQEAEVIAFLKSQGFEVEE